jgi:hypothetical protein
MGRDGRLMTDRLNMCVSVTAESSPSNSIVRTIVSRSFTMVEVETELPCLIETSEICIIDDQ